LGILAIIAHAVFTVSSGMRYRLGRSPHRLRRVAAEEIGRKEASKRSAHCMVIGSSREPVRQGPCVDVHHQHETCDRHPDIQPLPAAAPGAIASS